MKKYEKYLDEAINPRDPAVFRNVKHAKIKAEYDSIKHLADGISATPEDKKKWKKVLSHLDKALAVMVTI